MTSLSQEVLDALLATEEDGGAIEIILPVGASFINWQSNVRAKLSRLNPPKKLRTKYDKTEKKVTAWVEPKESDE